MSNSIATAKCPSALTSGNYGMSQNRYTDESKEYIFVKLTDSAYRAIEEYQFSDNDKRFTNGQGPKIKVSGNSGVIFFPTLGDRKFGFTIDDVEGSLECIQQTAEGLDVLGSIPYRMRIHANDDIYDTTRTKMAIAEETEKSKCIREIKPNQTDIGRKVKKSVPSSAVYQHLGHSGTSNNTNSSSNYLNSLNRNKTISSLNNNSPPATQLSLISGNERIHNKFGGTSSSSSRSPNPTLLGGSGTVAGSSNSGNNRYGSGSANNIYSQSNVSPSLTSASSLSSTLAGGITNGYASAAQLNSPSESTTSTLPNNCVGGGKQSRLGNNAASGNSNFSRSGGSSFSSNGPKASSGAKGGGASNANSGGGKLPDISRRKIRERLIHLLALRPFKKPELYSRLQNEGLRDRERSLISNILKDIATLSRDNTYNLRRQMWNDVNENWPYYTEQELQQLKRRKPQNLTPPLSSDAGSSTSGQSPTSIHTGSPPPIAGGSGLNGGNGLKRTSLEYDEPFVCTVQPKKQRISHFKKDAIAGANPVNSGSTNSCGVGNGSRGVSYGTNNSGGSTNYSMHRSKQASTASTYSPQGSRNAGHGDDSSGNTDLSYNVLNNMDDFMLNIEQQQGGSYLPHSSNSARKSSSSCNNKVAGSNPKENRHSGNSNSSSNVTNISPKSSNNIGNKNYNVQESEGSISNLKHTMKRGALAGSPKGSLPYGVNFVPESKNSSRSIGRDSSSTRNGGGNYHRQSPSYMQQQHQKSSVIYSPKMPTGEGSGTNEREEHVPTGRGGSTSNKSQAQSRLAASVATTGSKQQPRAGDVRTPTPQEQEQQRHLQQVSHYQSQQTHSASTHSPVQRYYNPPQHPYQQLEQQQPQLQSTSQLPPTQHSAITDAPNEDAAERPTYDFSMYTAIKSIEQRRQYKTEFERDFDEYNKLLERLEDVRRNFHVLAEQLRRVPQGCSDYEHIQQQIVAEYERIENEEELKRDKQRFYYLHAKLAHIKQLVTDYDHTLRSMVAAAAAAAEAAQQHASTTAAMHMAANVTSHLVDGSNNVLAAATAHNARVSPMVSGSESNHSPPSGYQHQTQYYAQQNEPGLFPQYQEHQQQQDEILHRKKNHTHNNVQHQNQQQQYLSPHNQAHTSPAGGQYSTQQEQQQQLEEQFNGHHHYMPAHADVGDEKIVRRTQEHRNNNNDINSCDSSDSNNEDSNDADLNDNDVDDGSDSSSNDENDDANDRY